MTFLALAALLVAPAIAGGLGDSKEASDLASRTIQLKEVAADPYASDEKVRHFSDRLFEAVPGVGIVVNTGMRGWDMEPEPEGKQKDPASIDRLMRSADKRFLFYNPSVPDPDLKDAYASARELHGARRIDYDGSMPGNQMGAYKYTPGSTEWGIVKVNDWIAAIAGTIGDVFAFCTVIHEAEHADRDRKGELSPDAVISGEIASFYVEHAWLSLVDPTGERLAFLYAKALDENALHPSALNEMVLKYAGHLYEVWGTRGDVKKIEELVRRRGYHERSEQHEHPKEPVRS